jgi:hypothetical protein
MKNLKNLFKQRLIVVLSLALIATSCDSWIDHDINVNPNSPGDVPLNLLLPAIQQSMGYNLVGNNSVRTNNIWMQQFDGTDRQSFTEARYQLTPADVGNLWNPIYAEMLINSKIMIDKSMTTGKESPHYTGVAQVLMATTLGIGTDLFGDMPYSEALEGGNNNFRPIYDSQESIYNSIFALIDAAIPNLNSTTNALAVTGDVSYAGNRTKWVKAANSIKARHLLQLSIKNGSAAYTAALAAVAGGFTSNADDFKVPFEAANKNPIYQFMEQRTDIRMGSTLVNMMKANNDPRLPFYAEKDAGGNYTGSVPGSQNANASRPGTSVAGIAAPTYLMTYAELKFIEAECKLMLNQAGAQAAYEAAVKASVERVAGVSAANTAWLAANINGIPVTLETLITQKYINGFGTNQPYADWRRTGFPALSLAAGAVINQIPTRFPYPQSELDYNASNVPAVTITGKVWWDN